MPGRININGGITLIEGKLVNINNQTIDLPILQEQIGGTVTSQTENINGIFVQTIKEK